MERTLAQADRPVSLLHAIGWRRTMEDAHLAQTGVASDPKCAIFGVFDGHGGAEVAKFCQRYMSAEIQKMEEFGQGNVEECLIRAFHKMVRAAVYTQRISGKVKCMMPAGWFTSIAFSNEAPGRLGQYSPTAK